MSLCKTSMVSLVISCFAVGQNWQCGSFPGWWLQVTDGTTTTSNDGCSPTSVTLTAAPMTGALIITGVAGLNYTVIATASTTQSPYVRAGGVTSCAQGNGYLNVLIDATTLLAPGTLTTPANNADGTTSTDFIGFNIAAPITVAVQVLIDYYPMGTCPQLTQAHLVVIP